MPQTAHEHHIKVQRTARYLTLGTPGPHIRNIWYVLHGYGQIASYFIKHFEEIADAETLVVAPEGLSLFYIPPGWTRVGATWMTKEKRLSEIEDYVAYLEQVHAAVSDPKAIGWVAPDVKITLLGFSQGATTAWRWARLGTIVPTHFVNWAGSVPEDGQANTDAWVGKTQLYYVHSSEDEYISKENAQKQIQLLQGRNPALKTFHFEGNHRMDNATLQAIYTEVLKT